MKKLVKIEAKKILATANIKGGSIGLQSSFSNDTGIVTGGVDPTCNKSTGYVVADNWRDYIDLYQKYTHTHTHTLILIKP